MGCQHLEELYELFLLGALSDQCTREIRQHLESGCAQCLARLHEAGEMVYLLTLTAKPVRPHPRVKADLLHHLHAK